MERSWRPGSAQSTHAIHAATSAPGKHTLTEQQPPIQRKATGTDAPDLGAIAPVAAGGGEPLPAQAKATMERAFGADFSDRDTAVAALLGPPDRGEYLRDPAGATAGTRRAVAGRMAALRIALGLLIGMVGCSRDGDPHGPCDLVGGPSTTSAEFGGIDYQVVGGIGGHGDGTMLHIQPDGSFTRYTYAHGTEHGQLNATALRDIVGKARAAEFPTLCINYNDDQITDAFFDEVSVQFDGSVLTSRASERGDPPDRLQAVIDALKQVVDRPLP